MSLINRGSSASFLGERTAGVPHAMLESRDWRLRSDDTPDVLKNRMPAGWTWRKLVHNRACYLGRAVPIPPRWGLDLAFVRYGRELEYVRRLRDLRESDVESLAPEGKVSSELLFRTDPRILRSGVPQNMARVIRMCDADAHMPLDWARWERIWRHKAQAFVPVHCREVQGIRDGRYHDRYTPLPSFWAEVEVPYGFPAESPEIVAYLGITLRENPYSELWLVARSEHAANCAVALMYSARKGKLYWLPKALCDDIRTIGTMFLMDGVSNLATQLESLLREIELIKWAQVFPANRLLPRETRATTPVFSSGDWVEFYPNDGWETKMSALMYHAEAASGGFAAEGRVTNGYYNGERGSPLVGTLAEGPRNPGPSMLPSAPSGGSRVERQLRSAFEKSGALSVLVEYDYEIPQTAYAAGALVRQLAKDLHEGGYVEERVESGPSQPDGEAPLLILCRVSRLAMMTSTHRPTLPPLEGLLVKPSATIGERIAVSARHLTGRVPCRLLVVVTVDIVA